MILHLKLAQEKECPVACNLGWRWRIQRPGFHAGKHSSMDGGWAGNLRKHRRAVSDVDAALMKHVVDMPPMRTSSNADGLGSMPQPGLDRLRLDDAGSTDSPRRQRRHSRYRKSLEML